MVGKPIIVLTNTKFDDFPVEVKNMLNEHVDIVADYFPNELPLVRSIDIINKETFKHTNFRREIRVLIIKREY